MNAKTFKPLYTCQLSRSTVKDSHLREEEEQIRVPSRMLSRVTSEMYPRAFILRSNTATFGSAPIPKRRDQPWLEED